MRWFRFLWRPWSFQIRRSSFATRTSIQIINSDSRLCKFFKVFLLGIWDLHRHERIEWFNWLLILMNFIYFLCAHNMWHSLLLLCLVVVSGCSRGVSSLRLRLLKCSAGNSLLMLLDLLLVARPLFVSQLLILVLLLTEFFVLFLGLNRIIMRDIGLMLVLFPILGIELLLPI